ncbi:MAG: cobalamin-binding protein, partial [bacterium]
MTATRIVSLLPSATEIICRLGLESQLVGISHECDYPATITHLPRLTRPKIDVHASSRDIDTAVRALSTEGLSVYAVDEALLASLHPDLIVTQDQCEVCAVDLAEVQRATATALGYDCPIVSLQPSRLVDVWDSVEYVAYGAGVAKRGATLRATLETGIRQIIDSIVRTKPRTIACLEWLDPLMYAGHWTIDLVHYPEPL